MHRMKQQIWQWVWQKTMARETYSMYFSCVKFLIKLLLTVCNDANNTDNEVCYLRSGRSIEQLGERISHGWRYSRRHGAWHRSQGGGGLRLSPGHPADALHRRRMRIRSRVQAPRWDERRVSRPHHRHLLRHSISKGQLIGLMACVSYLIRLSL